MRLTALVLFVLAVAVGGQEEVGLTVYSSMDALTFQPSEFMASAERSYGYTAGRSVPGFGVVRQTQTVELRPGPNELSFIDVAARIDPTSVSLVDLTSPNGTAVLDQEFQFDLVSGQKLLAKYLGQTVTVVVPANGDRPQAVSGTLLAASEGQMVLQTPQGVQILPAREAQIRLGDLPEGLITRPTLLWHVNAGTGGIHRLRTAYQTDGLTWRADYNLVLNRDDTAADLSAWVTLLNISGARYPNAELKLIAGDVRRVRRAGVQQVIGYDLDGQVGRAPEGFSERSFFEYHLYALPRRITVEDNSTQQITLMPPASGVRVEKVLVYAGFPQPYGWWHMLEPRLERELRTTVYSKVDIYLRFRNSADNHLGMPLPRGRMSVYKQDEGDGALEFLGEDLIDHTPRDETLLIRIGQAFDVVGERIQTDFKVSSGEHWMTETFRIQVRNAKDVAQRVLVKENLYRWHNWEITESSDPYEKIDSRTIHFPLEVPARGEKTVTYTVRYTW